MLEVNERIEGKSFLSILSVSRYSITRLFGICFLDLNGSLTAREPCKYAFWVIYVLDVKCTLPVDIQYSGSFETISLDLNISLTTRAL